MLCVSPQLLNCSVFLVLNTFYPSKQVEVTGFARNCSPFSSSIKGPDPCLQVLFGTADGQVIVMDCHGRMLAHVLLHESDGILSMSWNYPAFLVEDSSESDTDSDDYSPPQGSQQEEEGGRRCTILHGTLTYQEGLGDAQGRMAERLGLDSAIFPLPSLFSESPRRLMKLHWLRFH